MRDPDKTGHFEVRLLGAPAEVIHAKRTLGPNTCELDVNVDAVLGAIAAYLEAPDM